MKNGKLSFEVESAKQLTLANHKLFTLLKLMATNDAVETLRMRNNRVLNKFGKILKIESKSYFQLIVFIKIMVNHNGVLILNTYHLTGSKNL